MTLTLTLREAPPGRIDGSVFDPGRLRGLSEREIAALPLRCGRQSLRVDEVFEVSGTSDGHLLFGGDLSRVDSIGSAMPSGQIVVEGPCGDHVGARMSGGELVVRGDAGAWAGAELHGGVLVVRGNAGDRVGGAYPGARAGMTHGEIFVFGDAGQEAGACMRRGLVAVGGRAGAGAGLRMLAGTVIALGGLGAEAGMGNKRGSLVSGRGGGPPARLRLRHSLSPARSGPAAAPAAGGRPALRRRPGDRNLGALVWRQDRGRPGRDPDLRRRGGPVSLSMNERAAALVDGLVADAEALAIECRTLDSGARLVDCGAQAPGGLRAGLGFAAACMGGLGRIDPVPVLVGERAWPGVGVAVDQPAAACLAAQYAGWKLEHENFFAMASGPGRVLARAEDLFEELAWREQADRAVLCLETRQSPPAEIVDKVAQRCGLAPSQLTFLIAPTASVCGSVQISARVVETALHKLHELDVDPARVRSGWGCCPIAPVAKDDPTAIGRTNDAMLYGGTAHLWLEGSDEEVADLAQRLPSAASDAFGTPFGELLAAADWNFYDIDPMLFSPAAVTLTSIESGRAHHGGGLAPEVLERSFTR